MREKAKLEYDWAFFAVFVDISFTFLPVFSNNELLPLKFLITNYKTKTVCEIFLYVRNLSETNRVRVKYQKRFPLSGV